MARFFDGARAAAHEVTPQLAADTLLIRAAEGTLLATWPIADIRVRDRPDRSGAVTLSHREDPARLVIADQAVLRALSSAGVRIPIPRRWRPLHWVALSGALLAVLVGAVLLLDLLPRIVALALPVAWEDRFGAWTERSALRDQRRCTGPDGQRALDTLVARLRQAGGIDRPVRITVLNDPTVNALTLPGGRIVVMRGLIDKVDDGAELAAVIAHEMGHVAHRDPTTLLLRQLGLGVAAATFGWNDALGGAAGLAQGFLALSYSRRAEAAADAAAQQYLTRAGLRADGLGRFFARLEVLEGHGGDRQVGDPQDGGIPWLATHPPTEQRRAEATRSTAGAAPFTEAEWAALRTICR
jgi:beta-barrel assembly-enhancing protease